MLGTASSDGGRPEPVAVPLQAIRPYLSVIVLECTDPDPVVAFHRLRTELRRLRMRRKGRQEVLVVAEGADQQQLPSVDEVPLLVDALVVEVSAPPGWATQDAGFTETWHELAVWLGRSRLVALHCSETMAGRVQTWLDSSPAPPYRRVEPGVLHAALLGGEAKTLWLRGIHPRRTTKADTKTLSGIKLQDAIDPAADSSYAMGSARAELKPDPEVSSLSGVVGTTPRKSSVWFGPSQDLPDFAAKAVLLLRLLEGCIVRGDGVDRPYPLLATPVRDLADVRGAYDLSCPISEDVPAAELSDELAEAAELLQEAELLVRPRTGSAGFVLDVGLHGAVGGSLGCSVRKEGADVRLVFGFEGEPTDYSLVKPVLDALRECTDLLTVRYESGHSICLGGVWRQEIGTATFPNWTWSDFDGYDVTKEKPVKRKGSEVVHELIAENGDDSLFAWVVKTFGAKALLTCDDGPGEVADFVRLGYDGTVSLIHVKSAGSAKPERRMNVGQYEVVASQASKNAGYLDLEALRQRLSTTSLARPATWDDGRRVSGRDDLLELLRLHAANESKSIVIVQPQVTEKAYGAARSASVGAEALRARLLDTLLLGARSPITGYGADLEVHGCA